MKNGSNARLRGFGWHSAPGVADANRDSDDIDEFPGTEERGETILVVEDDDELRAYIADVLRGLGYRFRAVPNATAALPILEENERRIDLLLTDIVMPGRNGRELGKHAQSLRPDCRFFT